MLRIRCAAVCMLLVTLVSGGCVHSEVRQEAVPEAAKAACAEATRAGEQASLASEIARKALDNAAAAHRTAELRAAQAAQSGNKVEAKTAQDALRAAAVDFTETQHTVTAVFTHAKKARDSAAGATNAAWLATAAEQKSEGGVLAGKAVRLAAEAGRMAAKATELSEIVKKRWLSLVNNPPPAPPPTNAPVSSSPRK